MFLFCKITADPFQPTSNLQKQKSQNKKEMKKKKRRTLQYLLLLFRRWHFACWSNLRRTHETLSTIPYCSKILTLPWSLRRAKFYPTQYCLLLAGVTLCSVPFESGRRKRRSFLDFVQKRRDFLMRFYAKSEKFTDVELQWIRFQLVWKVSWIQDVFLMTVVKKIF